MDKDKSESLFRWNTTGNELVDSIKSKFDAMPEGFTKGTQTFILVCDRDFTHCTWFIADSSPAEIVYDVQAKAGVYGW